MTIPYKVNQVRLQLFALAYNLDNFLRRLVLPRPASKWSLRTLHEKLMKIGTEVISHLRHHSLNTAQLIKFEI
jgi:hypothetical protein